MPSAGAGVRGGGRRRRGRGGLSAVGWSSGVDRLGQPGLDHSARHHQDLARRLPDPHLVEITGAGHYRTKPPPPGSSHRCTPSCAPPRRSATTRPDGVTCSPNPHPDQRMNPWAVLRPDSGDGGAGGRGAPVAPAATPESELDGGNNGRPLPGGVEPAGVELGGEVLDLGGQQPDGPVAVPRHGPGWVGAARGLDPRQWRHWRISERRRGWGVAAIRASMSVSGQ